MGTVDRLASFFNDAQKAERFAVLAELAYQPVAPQDRVVLLNCGRPVMVAI